MMLSRIALLWICFLGLGACSSSPSSSKSSAPSTYLWEESDANSTAPGQAYVADSMHFRKPMPDRRVYRNWSFYFKHCAVNGQDAYYSKTAYDCTEPY